MSAIIKNGKMAITASGDDPRPDSFHSIEDWQDLLSDSEQAIGQNPAAAFAELADAIYGKTTPDPGAVARQADVKSIDGLVDRVYGTGPNPSSPSPAVTNPAPSEVPDLVGTLDPEVIFRRYNGPRK